MFAQPDEYIILVFLLIAIVFWSGSAGTIKQPRSYLPDLAALSISRRWMALMRDW
jgi:hypothetical protein